MKTAYKNIFKATTLFGGVQLFNIIINLVRTKLVAMILGPEGVGIHSIYNETKELVHESTNIGMDQSGVRGISLAYEKLKNASSEQETAICRENLRQQITYVRSWEIILSLFGALVMILFAHPLSLMTFQDTEHTWAYIMLAPAVTFSTITCGELVVLKAIRKIKSVAMLSSVNVVLALVVTIPIYYVSGLSGIVPAIIALSLCSAVITVFVSYRYNKLYIYWHWRELREALPMLKLGLCFVITGAMAHGMELLIMSHINGESDEATVGLYRAGYTITGTYAALLFNAVSADFFPRLSGVVNDVKQRTTTVCQQMEVLLMLVGPMSVALLVAMPVLVPLLYDYTFVDMIPMTRIAVFGVLFSAAYIPAAYLPLAAGDSKMFLFVETISTITMLLIIVGFSMEGLVGAGVGKVVSTVIDTVSIFAVAIWYYKVRLSYSYIFLLGCHVLLLVASFAVTSILTGVWYWVAGVGILLLSILTSWEFYKRKAVSQ